MTLISLTPVFDAEYLRNGTRYRHSYYELPIGSHALLRMTLSNFMTVASPGFSARWRSACVFTKSHKLLHYCNKLTCPSAHTGDVSRRGSRKNIWGLAPLNFLSLPFFPPLFPSPPLPLKLSLPSLSPFPSLPFPPSSPFLFPHPFLPLPFPLSFPSPPSP